MKTGNRNLRFLCLLGTLALASWAVQAEQATDSQQVGHVVAASGSLKLIGPDGQERKAARQTPIFRQDTVRVGDNGYLQLRFTDGSLLALRAGTEFKVAEYKFDAKQRGEEKAVFQLLKGGLRTITGAIGKANPDEYKVETPVATIGIRGTHYGLRICEHQICGEEVADGLYGGIADGAIGVTNQGGDRTFGNDRFFYVRDRDTLAQDWLEPKGLIFEGFGPPLARAKNDADKLASPTQRPFSAAGSSADEIAWLQSVQSSSEANPAYVESDNFPPHHEEPPPAPTITGTPAPLGSVALTAFKGHDAAGNTLWVSGAVVQGDPATIYTDTRSGVSQLVTHLESANLPPCAPGCTLELASASFGEGSWDDGTMISWGRWGSGWTLAQNGQPGEAIGGWQVIYTSQPTAMADMQDLQQRGVTATFDLYSAPSPTDEQGNGGQYLSEYTSMRVDFGQGLITDYQLGVSFAQTQREFFGTLAEPTAISSLPTSLHLDVACTGCTTAEGAGSASVAFAGSGAGYALTSWEMHTLDQSQGAVGTALLVKHEYVEPPPITGNAAPMGSVALTSFKAHDPDGNIIWVSGSVPQSDPATIYIDNQEGTAGTVTHLEAAQLPDCPSCTLDQADATLEEGHSTGLYTWGRWLSGWSLSEDGLAGEPFGSWHVLYTDRPTQQDELYALAGAGVRASFHLLEGTTPTDAAGNLGVYQQDRPILIVDFGSGIVYAYEVGVSFPTTGIDLSGWLAEPIGLSSATSGFPLQVACIGCDSPTGTGHADIIFAGSNASYALNSWFMDAGNGQGAVGTAVLLQNPLVGSPATAGSITLTAFAGDLGYNTPIWVAGATTQGDPATVYLTEINGSPNVITGMVEVQTPICDPSCVILADRADYNMLSTTIGTSSEILMNSGRWGTGWSFFYGGNAAQGLGDWQYLYTDQATTPADLTSLQLGGVVANFGLFDALAPTDEMGNEGEYRSVYPAMTVDFGQRMVTAYNLDVYFPATGRDFSGWLAEHTPFSSIPVDLALNVSCSGCDTSGSTPGTGSASVAFVGSEAEFAITSWEMHTEDQTKGAVGTATLTQVSEPLPEGAIVFGRGQSQSPGHWADSVYISSDYTLGEVDGHANAVTLIRGDNISRSTETLIEYGEEVQPGLSASWGRWGENWEVYSDGVNTGPFQFIQSTTPAPQSLVDNLGNAGAVAYFEPVSGKGTPPTDGLGNTGQYDYNSPRATVDFGTSQVVAYFVQATMPTERVFQGSLTEPVLLSQADYMPLDVYCSGCSNRYSSQPNGTGSASLYLVGGGSGTSAAHFNDTGVDVGSLHAITAFSMSAGNLPQDFVAGTQLLEPASIIATPGARH